MDELDEPIVIDMRIPGNWAHPSELAKRLPAGCSWTGQTLRLADGSEFEFGVVPADNEFANVFRSACRQEATEEELAVVDSYTVNVLLSGPGGSMEAALQTMEAAAAVVLAGGAGVFIDNSFLAHGGENWIAMTQDGGSDALSFAFVAVIEGKTEVWTVGMHVLGFRDLVMKRADVDADNGIHIIEMIRYLARGEKTVDNGHVIADLSGPRFQVFTEEGDEALLGSAAYNPFGRFRLVSVRDIAESN